MLVVRIGACVLVAGALSLFGGCASVGPIAIDQGRDRYNHIIQETSKEQTFANIIRVYHHEPTSFMEVTEVDASTTFSGTVNGGLSSIGAIPGTKSTSAGTISGQLGNVAGGVTYTEAPLIRYQPLLGQALVGQLATPVSPDALASLFDSYWGIVPLLDLSTGYMTLDSDNGYAALSALAYLEKHTRLELVAEKSELTKGKDSTASGPIKGSNAGGVTLEVTNKATSASTPDALAFYLRPPHARGSGDDGQVRTLWNLLLRFYAGTQSRPAQKTGAMCPAGKCIDVTPLMNRIELRTMPVTADKMKTARLTSGAPSMRTYSALGILKNATEQPYPKIAFVTRERYEIITSHPWNDFSAKTGNRSLNFYTLLPGNEREGAGDEREGDEGSKDPVIDKKVSDWLCNIELKLDTPYVYAPSFAHRQIKFNYDDFVDGNQRLGRLRRYILLISSDSPPVNAYVAHFDRGKWYYIDGDDEISQKNFDLISLLLTMMAVPGAAQQPLTPAITVGGGGM